MKKTIKKKKSKIKTGTGIQLRLPLVYVNLHAHYDGWIPFGKKYHKKTKSIK